MTTVSVHQPNFLPWLGYFEKLMQSDVHIVLDDVLTARGTWLNRVKVMCSGNPRWLTVPLDRSQGSLVQINRLRAAPGWSSHVLNRLTEYYRGFPHFRDVRAFIMPLLVESRTELSESNLQISTRLLQELGLRPPQIIPSSTLGIDSNSSLKIAELVEKVGGVRYLSGTGADGYLNIEIFETRGIAVDYVKVVEVPYPQQHAEVFHSGLSIIDALFTLGFDEVGRRIIDAAPQK